MSAAHDLKTLLAGKRPVGGLLQTIRLEAGGAEFYGEEAVLERCRAHGHDWNEADAVAAPGHLLLHRKKGAVVADLHGERLGRVWLIGGEAGEPEPAVLVAFDPDLAQARGDVLAEVADHPRLDPAGFGPLLDAARALVAEVAADDPPRYRVRAFLIRAWSEGDRHVGLIALHMLGAGPERPAAWGYAALLVEDGEARHWRDRHGVRPRLHPTL